LNQAFNLDIDGLIMLQAQYRLLGPKSASTRDRE